MIRASFGAVASVVAALGLSVCTDTARVSAEESPARLDGVSLPKAATTALPPSASAPPRSVEPMPSLAPLVKELRPSVVNIYTTQNVRSRGFNRGGDDLFDWFFRGGPQRPQGREEMMKRQALGSGVLIGDGLALTNNHVVERADEIKVKLADGREFDAKIVGRDPSTDVALLELEGDGVKELPSVALGDSDATEVGDYVVAIGNPFGLSHTVTSGIVSAKERIIGAGPYDDFIQTDASINPGNSGGPLFNLRGEVIGINTAIVAQGQGIGFAVPINLVKSLLPQLRESGHVSRGWLGVGIQEVTPELGRTFGVKPGEGVLIAQVFEDSPAERAGMESGDIVREFNGRRVTNPNELSRAVAAVKPGTKAKVSVLRDGKARELTVELDERDAEGAGPVVGDKRTEQPADALIGLSLTPLTPDVARRYDVDSGVGLLVQEVKPGTAAERAGVRPGDVLIDIQRRRVRTLEDYRKATAGVKKGDGVLFRVLRGGAAIFLTSHA